MSALMARRYYTRGITELRGNELDDACQDLQAAVQLIPSYYEARIAYATALLKLKDPPRAIQTLRAGLHYTTSGPGRALLCRAFGDALVAGGDFLAAEQAFAESQAVSPQGPCRSARSPGTGCGPELAASTRPSPSYSPPPDSPARPSELSR